MLSLPAPWSNQGVMCRFSPALHGGFILTERDRDGPAGVFGLDGSVALAGCVCPCRFEDSVSGWWRLASRVRGTAPVRRSAVDHHGRATAALSEVVRHMRPGLAFFGCPPQPERLGGDPRYSPVPVVLSD
jgi:hypothetical protein